MSSAIESGAALRLVDPCGFSGWDTQLERFSGASVFHGSAWARVLGQTYGHQPCYSCQFEQGRLAACLPVMQVASPWTGKRGVALPFTDCCPPLVLKGNAAHLYQHAVAHGRENRWKYLEARSPAPDWEGSEPAVSFYTHALDLQPDPGKAFQNLHPAVRRGVRRAESAGLQTEFRSDPEAVQMYFRLHCLTRQRHGLPPQPFAFFQNIQRLLLAPGQGFVALAFASGAPVAGAVFLHFRGHAIYKFGASDHAFQGFRPNNLVMWRAIGHLGKIGCSDLHFGRTSRFNSGLRRYKLGFGAQEHTVTYTRYHFQKAAFVRSADRSETWVNTVFRRCPVPLLRFAGKLLYEHIA